MALIVLSKAPKIFAFSSQMGFFVVKKKKRNDDSQRHERKLKRRKFWKHDCIATHSKREICP